MRYVMVVGIALAALTPTVARAQHASHAGEASRQIKALSHEETKQYLSGAGMGYARAAELNHYPGPMHVLELAEKLALTQEQRAATVTLMQAHKDEARTIGSKLIEAEAALDLLFASGSITGPALADGVRTIAALQGEYRLSHLETHRRMRAILTSEQVRRYDQLRGHSDAVFGRPDGRDHSRQ